MSAGSFERAVTRGRTGVASGTEGTSRSPTAPGGTSRSPTAPEGTPLWGLLDVTTPLPSEPAKLDGIDRQLLALLAADSRASQRKLARQLHMSPPAVGERIARLERLGVIQGYTVRIDWTALGFEMVVLAVTAGQGADQAAIIQALQRLPELEEVVVVTGSMDMLARLRVRDHAHLRQVLLAEIWRIEGVQRTETFLGLAGMPAKESYVADLLGSTELSGSGPSGGDNGDAGGAEGRP